MPRRGAGPYNSRPMLFFIERITRRAWGRASPHLLYLLFRGPWPRASPRATKPGRGSKRTVNNERRQHDCNSTPSALTLHQQPSTQHAPARDETARPGPGIAYRIPQARPRSGAGREPQPGHPPTPLVGRYQDLNPKLPQSRDLLYGAQRSSEGGSLVRVAASRQASRGGRNAGDLDAARSDCHAECAIRDDQRPRPTVSSDRQTCVKPISARRARHGA